MGWELTHAWRVDDSIPVGYVYVRTNLKIPPNSTCLFSFFEVDEKIWREKNWWTLRKNLHAGIVVVDALAEAQTNWRATTWYACPALPKSPYTE